MNFAKSITPDYWEKRSQIFDFQSAGDFMWSEGLLAKYVGRQRVTFKGPAVHVRARSAAQCNQLGQLTLKDKPDNSAVPAALARSHGQGRVVYLAAGFDAAYYLYAYPYQRLLLKTAIEWAAQRPKPMTVEAPKCVHTTVMRTRLKDNRQSLVVHLYNDVNTTGNHALPVDDVPLREETLPVHNISVQFSPAYKFQRIHLEPEGLDLPSEETSAGTWMRVPMLHVHAMIVGVLDQ